MKRKVCVWLAAALLLTSCGTGRMAENHAAGIFTGASIGNNLGGLIGGLIGESNDGWDGGYRGSAIGSIVGTVAGAAIGHVITHPRKEKVYAEERTSAVEELEPSYSPVENLRIHNIRFIEENEDRIISSLESCRIIFEIVNEGNETAYDIVPLITEVSGQKRLSISPSVLIEQMEPGDGIKYTAYVKVGKRIRTGEAVFRVAVRDAAGREFDWQEFAIETRR